MGGQRAVRAGVHWGDNRLFLADDGHARVVAHSAYIAELLLDVRS